MRGEEDDLVGVCRTSEDGDGVPCLFAGDVLEAGDALLRLGWKRIGERRLLQEGVIVASGFEAESLKLGCCKEGCNVLVACGGAATV